jgi:hypothetical protein
MNSAALLSAEHALEHGEHIDAGSAAVKWAKKTGVFKPVFKSPRWHWWALIIPGLILVSYLAVRHFPRVSFRVFSV